MNANIRLQSDPARIRAAARGERPIDTEWLRTELGLTAPFSERLP